MRLNTTKRTYRQLYFVALLTLCLGLSPLMPTSSVLARANTSSAAAEDPGILSVVGLNGASLLDAPNGNSVASISIGKVVWATKRSADGAWIYVRMDDGDVSGWLLLDEIVIFDAGRLPVGEGARAPASAPASAPVPASPAPATMPASPAQPSSGYHTAAAGRTATVTLQGARLNVRSGPGTNYPIIGSANTNDVYSVQNQDATGYWVQINFPAAGGQSAWVYSGYVQLSNAVAATSSPAPAYSPPAQSQPTYTQPTYSPPTQPAYTPPAYSAPAYTPPAYSPPAYSPPAYSPPATTAPTATAVQHEVDQGPGDSPEMAGTPPSDPVLLKANEWHWYTFQPQQPLTGENAKINIQMSVQEGDATFEIWTDAMVNLWRNLHEFEPLGKGTQNSVLPGEPEHYWSSSFEHNEVFYLIVKNEQHTGTKDAAIYVLDVSGNVSFP
ncbi:MAG: SH3 domain-containing protein [Chloroflexota bacterium]